LDLNRKEDEQDTARRGRKGTSRRRFFCFSVRGNDEESEERRGIPPAFPFSLFNPHLLFSSAA